MICCENPYCGTSENITRHHVLPKGFRIYPKRKNVMLCRRCHTIVHQLKTNLELGTQYNTYEKVIQLLIELTMPVRNNEYVRIIPLVTKKTARIRSMYDYTMISEHSNQMQKIAMA